MVRDSSSAVSSWTTRLAEIAQASPTASTEEAATTSIRRTSCRTSPRVSEAAMPNTGRIMGATTIAAMTAAGWSLASPRVAITTDRASRTPYRATHGAPSARKSDWRIRTRSAGR